MKAQTLAELRASALSLMDETEEMNHFGTKWLNRWINDGLASLQFGWDSPPFTFMEKDADVPDRLPPKYHHLLAVYAAAHMALGDGNYAQFNCHWKEFIRGHKDYLAYLKAEAKKQK